MTSTLTHIRLISLLSYDPDDGIFRWLVRRSNVSAGSIAGGNHGTGYKVIGIDGRLYLAHRLAWFFVHGRWPSDQLDHINGVKDDNRLANLREATTSENHQNMPLPRNNRSGAIGVNHCRSTGRWVAQITTNGQRKTLGRFETVEEASKAYREAKAQFHSFQPTVRAVALHLRGIGVG